MNGTSFRLQVVTPDGTACDEQVTSVLLPSAEGQMNVLPQHVNYVGILTTGVLEYWSLEDRTVKRLVVSGGFCNFLDETLVVISPKVDRPESVDREATAKEREDVVRALHEGSEYDAEFPARKAQLERLDAIAEIDRS